MRTNTISAATLLAATMLMTACFPEPDTLTDNNTDRQDPTTEDTHTANTRAFTFHIKGDFATSYEDMTRAAVRLEDNNTAAITDIWVLDYDQHGTLLQQVHQTSTQQGITFGSVPMTLTYGQHDIRLIASKGTTPTLSATNGTASTTDSPHTLQWEKVLDTFCLSYPIEVTSSSNGNRAPELKRCISGITIQNTDPVPATAKQIQVTIAKRYGTLALPSLIGTGDAAYTNTFTLPTADVGVTGIQFNTYTICPDDTFTSDVSVRVIGNDNSIISEFSFNDVELKQNRRTVLRGECFDRSSGFSVAVDNAWLDDAVVSF